MIWDVFLLLSVFWVCFRLYQLSKIPREVLEERLGYDIPPVPEVSIAGVKTRCVTLYWLNAKDTGFLGSTLSVLCNGIKLGTFNQGESSVEISPLKRGCCYSVKLVSTNGANISTISAATRIQTLPEQESSDSSAEEVEREPARIQTTPSPYSGNASQSSPKECAAPQQVVTKNGGGRRAVSPTQSSPPSHSEMFQACDSDEEDSSEYIQSLTHRLESLKRQKEDVDKQIDDEEAEAKSSQGDLLRERDHLRHGLKDKEDSSAELRRQGNQLDKLNRSAQSRKSTKERLLHQKKAERQRVKNDIERWDSEVVITSEEIKTMENELVSLNAINEGDVAVLRRALSADQNAIKAIEDEIRIKGAQIKDLEQRKDKMTDTSSTYQEQTTSDKASDEAWEANFQSLQIRLGSMWSALQQSKNEEQHAEEQVSWWLTKRANNAEGFSPASFLDTFPFPQRQRSRRTGRNHSGSNTHSNGGASSFHSVAPPPHNLNSGAYQTSIKMPLTQSDEQNSFRQGKVVDLIGGGMMSPAANDLLPSYLLRDEDVAGRPAMVGESENDATGYYFRHALTNSDASVRGPNTPVSTSSRTGSVFTSPHDSMQNVSSFMPDSDRNSSNSTGASLPTNFNCTTSQPSGRLANLFSSSFGRQRGKSNAQEPPALGTLKQGQSQSFPRNMEEDAMDSSGLRRRRGSHGTWANPVAGLLGKNGADPQGNIVRARTGSGRSSRLNVFKARMNPLDASELGDQEPFSSRPSSTYSYDQPFSRPSSESQSIWSSIGENLPNRNSPLNVKWSTPNGPWSREPSRRASVQQGSSTNLSLGSTPLDTEDITRSLSKHRPEQAPIGTRPLVQRSTTPKLNPAAPSFKTLFSRSEAKKAAKADKVSNKPADVVRGKESERGDTDGNDFTEDASPPTSRLSRDAQSITTAASTADSHDSFERSISGATSESPTPKESLMQKITRKSSSSKFNVPWSKDRGIFSKRAGEPSTPGEIDEDTPSEGQQQGKDADSTPHTPREEKSGRAWPSIRRKSKKGVGAMEKESDAGDQDE